MPVCIRVIPQNRKLDFVGPYTVGSRLSERTEKTCAKLTSRPEAAQSSQLTRLILQLPSAGP